MDRRKSICVIKCVVIDNMALNMSHVYNSPLNLMEGYPMKLLEAHENSYAIKGGLNDKTWCKS